MEEMFVSEIDEEGNNDGGRGGIGIFYRTEKPDKTRFSEENQAKILIFGIKWVI